MEGNRRLDHREAAAVVADAADLWFVGRGDHVDERALAADDVAGRHGEDARDARRRETLEVGRVHAHVIGRVDLRAKDGGALPSLDLFGRARILRLRRHRRVHAGGRPEIDEPRIDRQTLRVVHAGVGRWRHIGAHRLDEPAANHHRSRGNRGARRRNDARAGDRVDVRRIAARREGQRGAGHHRRDRRESTRVAQHMGHLFPPKGHRPQSPKPKPTGSAGLKSSPAKPGPAGLKSSPALRA